MSSVWSFTSGLSRNFSRYKRPADGRGSQICLLSVCRLRNTLTAMCWPGETFSRILVWKVGVFISHFYHPAYISLCSAWSWFCPTWKPLKEKSGTRGLSCSVCMITDHVVALQTAFFDVPLHMNFNQASRERTRYDLRKILNNTIVQVKPNAAVTFVDNHEYAFFRIYCIHYSTFCSTVRTWVLISWINN